MIERGSHTPGIRVADFGLPPDTALRIERVAEPLRGVLSSYAVLDSDPSLQSDHGNWILPGWARLWIALAPKPLDVSIRNRHYARLGSAMLFGVTSRAMPTTTYGGVSVAIDIGPVAWARLFEPSAELLRDRITPLDELLPPGWSEDLVACIARCDCGSDIRSAVDDFFLQRMPPRHPQEHLIAKIAALLVDENTHDLADAVAQVGVGKRALTDLSKRYFGFPPKILSMRTRFLRALTPMMLATDAAHFASAPAGYHDFPHFIRDANRFLGLTPRRFLANEMPFTRAVLRARLLVTGSATSALEKNAVEP